ncbi:MAG: hypothetical protein M5R36_24905 [Deltaproteobacteria bacterium]|nr:hypothetical protein [Deltaproteobacteria bacterium]
MTPSPRRKGLECADEDLEARYAEIAGRYNRSVAEIAAEYQKDDHVEDLKFSIRQDKALDFLFEHANVTWVDPPKDDDGGEE